MNTVGERVKWARTQRKLSQKQLAERAGVSTGMIGNLESGTRDRPRELVAIARALDASVTWLDTGEGEWEAKPTLDSPAEEVFLQLAQDWDVQVMKLRPQDAARLPPWLTEAFGKGSRYVPDFEMFVPGREAPVWIECKGVAMFFGEQRLERYRELERLSAGGGKQQVEIDLVKENPQAFRSEWIRLMRLKPAKLAAMRASGDSMEPTIHDGDSLLIDTSQTDVQDKKVYALWYDGGERVKRLFRLPGGGLRIKSDNPEYDTIELGPDYAGSVRIIGRVVHRSGTGGL